MHSVLFSSLDYDASISILSPELVISYIQLAKSEIPLSRVYKLCYLPRQVDVDPCFYKDRRLSQVFKALQGRS